MDDEEINYVPSHYPELHPIRDMVLSYIELPEETQNRIYWVYLPNEVITENLQNIREESRRGNVNYIKIYDDLKECVQVENENLFKFNWDIFYWALNFGLEAVELDSVNEEIVLKIIQSILSMGATFKHSDMGYAPRRITNLYLKYIGDKFIENHIERVKYNRNMYSLIDLKKFPEHILEKHLIWLPENLV